MFSKIRTIVLLSYCTIAPFFSACSSSSDIFPDIGTNIASPSALAVDSASRRLYVVNSNSEVLYDFQQGSFQVLNIADRARPQLLRTAATMSFSGEIFLDVANGRAYVPNRFSSGPEAAEDRLFTINIDEASGAFMSISETPAGLDPFAVAGFDPTRANRFYMTTSQGILQYVDVAGGVLTVRSVNLLRELSTGGTLSRAELLDVAIIGNQAFVVRSGGGIFVVNLAELDDASKNPVDYFISDIPFPRGVTVRGTNLLVTDEDFENDPVRPRLLLLNPAPLTPLTDNQTTNAIDKDTQGIVAANVEICRTPQQVAVAGDRAFVTCESDDVVDVVDLTTNTRVKSIAVGDEPFSLAVDAPGGVPTTLFVGNVAGNTISIIDITDSNLPVIATYP